MTMSACGCSSQDGRVDGVCRWFDDRGKRNAGQPGGWSSWRRVRTAAGSWRETRSSSVVWGNLPGLDPRLITHWYGLRSAELQRGSVFGPAEPPSVTRHVVTISVAELVQIGAAGRALRVEESWFLSTPRLRVFSTSFCAPNSQR